MKISEIYEKFDLIGCLTFATIDHEFPQTRIAHLFAYDDEGLYFRTMITKAFYKQLKATEKISICGMFPKTMVSYNEKKEPFFAPGYTIRATGWVKEMSLESLKEKADKDDSFLVGIRDIEKYPATTVFCIYKGWGEIFDFDFATSKRSHKLLRTELSFGGMKIPFRGVRITDECTACGECMEGCSFKAIYEQKDQYRIDHAKCDVCGDCYTTCPADAIEIVVEPPGEERQ